MVLLPVKELNDFFKIYGHIVRADDSISLLTVVLG